MEAKRGESQPGSDDRNWLKQQLELFESKDPVFDVDIRPVAWLRLRRRRKVARVAPMALLIFALHGCGGGGAEPMLARDAILVQLEPDAAPPNAAPADESGPPIVALTRLSEDEDGALLRIPLPAGADPVEAAARAAGNPGVAFAEPIEIYRTARAPNDPRYRDLWGLAQVQAPAAWATTVGSPDVVVAVVDDGVALDHPDLRPNLWVNPSEIPGNGEDDDADGFVDDVNGADLVDHDGDPSPAETGAERWHGSHVSGTIGASGDNRLGVVGLNWKVSLMAVRALGPRGGRSDDIARGIDFAAAHGARVINASWGGGGSSQAIANAISRAGKKGALFVAAAGNEGAATPSFPANLGFDSILSVGATTPDDLLADFSNRGALVAAPGVGILSTTAPGRYERYDGTSMAAPLVSGLAALLWAAKPGATLSQVRKAILESVTPVAGVRYGRVDAARALAALDGGGGAPAGLKLSRELLTYGLRTGRTPRAQVISIRAEGGARRSWTAQPDVPWILLSTASGQAPGRVSVRIDPAKAGTATEGHVQFRDSDGKGPSLTIRLQHVGAQPLVQVSGQGCTFDGGVLHAAAGSGCTLRAAGAEAPSVSWSLPGGARASGERLDGQFVRRGQYQIFVSTDEGELDAVPVVVE